MGAFVVSVVVVVVVVVPTLPCSVSQALSASGLPRRSRSASRRRQEMPKATA